MKTVICIPTYNEAENLSKLVSALLIAVPSLHILVIDDNSPDGTGKMADDLGVQHPGQIFCLHRAGKLGLGTAYIQGWKWALENGYEAIGQMDADFSHPVDKVAVLQEKLISGGGDAVIGSRYVNGGGLDERWPAWRKALSAFGNFYARTILGLPMRDCTGGFRLWNARVLRSMPLDRIRSNGYVFQVETAYVAVRQGFRFIETPIYFADRRWGTSKMNIKIQLEAAIRCWQLRGMYRDLKS